MRVKMLTVLATAVAVVGIGVLPSMASAATPEAATTKAAPGAEAGIRSLPPAEQARVKSDCPASYICFWSGQTFGTGECEAGLNCFSAFHGYEVGSHALANINPQSMYNHTGEHLAVFYDNFPLGPVETGAYPGETKQWGSRWTDGFEIR